MVLAIWHFTEQQQKDNLLPPVSLHIEIAHREKGKGLILGIVKNILHLDKIDRYYVIFLNNVLSIKKI